MDNVIEMNQWIDPIKALQRAAGSSKVIACYFDKDGNLESYVGGELTHMEKVYAVNSLQEIIKPDAQ